MMPSARHESAMAKLSGVLRAGLAGSLQRASAGTSKADGKPVAVHLFSGEPPLERSFRRWKDVLATR